MKKALVSIGLAAALGVVIGPSVSAHTPPRDTWLICDNGSRYTHRPKRCEFRVGDHLIPVRHLHWHHWGSRRATARGKFIGKVHVVAYYRARARRCVHPGARDWFYERAKIRTAGITETVKRSSLKPHC
jgi:hypothetical protein